MEMNLFHFHAMHFSFRFGDESEDRLGISSHGLTYRNRVKKVPDILHGCVMVVVMMLMVVIVIVIVVMFMVVVVVVIVVMFMLVIVVMMMVMVVIMMMVMIVMFMNVLRDFFLSRHHATQMRSADAHALHRL
jgi:amino acid transporter